MKGLKEEVISAQTLALLLLALVFMVKVIFIIWQFSDGKFLVAPGGDPLNHIAIIENILHGQLTGLSYPPLFHFLIAGIVKLTGFSVIATTKVAAIALFFLSIAVFGWLAKKLFGFWPAFWAMLFYLTVSSHPLLGFVDGNYPDLLNYGVFVPLFLVCLLNALRNQPFKWTLVSLAPLILMILTHHLTTSFMLVIVAAYLLVMGLYHSLNHDRAARKNLFIVCGVYLIISIPIGILVHQMFGNVLTQAFKSVSDFVPLYSGTTYSEAPRYDNLAPLLNPFIEYLGLLGLVLCLATVKKNPEAKILVMVWTVALWLMSRTPLSGLPPRFLREINVPLTLLAGYGVALVVTELVDRRHKLAVSALFGYLIYINLVQLNVGPFMLPGGFKSMVWYRAVDQEKVNYLRHDLPDGAKVLANPANPYVNYFFKHDYAGSTQLATLIPNSQVPPKDNGTYQPIAVKLVQDSAAQYLFIGAEPQKDIDEKTFVQFAGYKLATQLLETYPYGKKDIVKQFDDGSKIIKIDPTVIQIKK